MTFSRQDYMVQPVSAGKARWRLRHCCKIPISVYVALLGFQSHRGETFPGFYVHQVSIKFYLRVGVEGSVIAAGIAEARQKQERNCSSARNSPLPCALFIDSKRVGTLSFIDEHTNKQ